MTPAGVPNGAEWDRAATFVVSFEQRGAGPGCEQRLVVELTEIEPEQPPRVWPSWDCGDICAWMLEELATARAREI